MSCKHQISVFSSFSFIDTKICNGNGKFVTTVLGKSTFSGVFIDYESFITTYQIKGLLYKSNHRSSSICCDFKTDHLEIKSFKDFPQTFHIVQVISHFLITFLHLKLLLSCHS